VYKKERKPEHRKENKYPRNKNEKKKNDKGTRKEEHINVTREPMTTFLSPILSTARHKNV
jgi:hypothetical protein